MKIVRRFLPVLFITSAAAFMLTGCAKMVYKDWAFFPFDYKENTYNSLDSYVSQVVEKAAEKNNFTVQEFDLPW